MTFLRWRLYFLKIQAPQDSKSWKFLVEAHQYTALSCFTACFNLLAQFNKLYPWTLKNLTSGDQMERTNLKCKNLRPSIGQKHLRLRDAKISWKQDFWDPSKMLPRFWHWTKIFWDPHFSGYRSIPIKCKVQLTSDTLYQFIYTIKWLILNGFLLCLFHRLLREL